jgi:hypothetical protein
MTLHNHRSTLVGSMRCRYQACELLISPVNIFTWYCRTENTRQKYQFGPIVFTNCPQNFAQKRMSPPVPQTIVKGKKYI